VKKRKRLNWLY